MADGPDRQFLLSVFLMEAWDTIAAIEDALTVLAISAIDASSEAATGGADRLAAAAGAIEQMRLVTHRLRGASALNGFPQVSALAGLMENAVDGTIGSTVADRERVLAPFGELIACLKEALDEIGARGSEDAESIAAVVARHAPAPAVAGPVVDRLTGLDHYFKNNGDVLEYFVPEATEHLDSMAQSLLALERQGTNPDELARLFRAVHTLKGAAYTVGCALIGDFAHRLEDLLSEIREAQRPLTPGVIEAVFAGLDALRLLVRSAEGVPPGRVEAYDRALSLLDGLGSEPSESTEPAPAEAVTEAAIVSPEGAELVPVAAAPPSRAAGDGAPVVRPSTRVSLDRLDALMNLVGELVIARGRLERHLTQLDQVGDLLTFTQTRMRQNVAEFERKYLDPRLPGAAPDGEALVRTSGQRDSSSATPPDSGAVGDVFAELEFDRYDDFNILARRVGEITGDISEIQQQLAGLMRMVRADATRIQQLSGELRGEITRARMVPLGRLFARFARQVREAARSTGKTVSLQVSGEGVEMDNTVIEQITDPLTHLLQNAIAHGIEDEEERQQRGKSPHGVIRLSAAHKGSIIVVEVADDGRGIDVEAVKAAALEGGFVSAAALAEMSDRDILDLIFLPGFSTATAVTTAAGRGVGMDVVRTNVGRLGGEIDIHTEVGAGTRFTIRLPLTVAISDALMVRIGAQVLALAVPAVKAMTRIRPEEVRMVDGREAVEIEGELTDLVYLERVLGLPSLHAGGARPVAALRTGRRPLAIAVDELLGKEEIVIKSLGAFLEGVGPFAAATVSGEGRVILLLDPVKLLAASPLANIGRSAARETAATHAGPGQGARRKVLLVDDSVSVRKFVGQMLERAGFDVVTANDGAHAMQVLDDATFDVVVTDLEMPRRNGYELIRDLRRRPAIRDVPVVVLTTRAGEKHVNLARQLGVRHYVTKPVDEHAFVHLIGTLTAKAPAGMAV